MSRIDPFEGSVNIPLGPQASPRADVAAAVDSINDLNHAPIAVADAARGWDTYEVWRRFIKDPRDRRRELQGRQGSEPMARGLTRFR